MKASAAKTKATFSFSEVLVLLDVEHDGPLSEPLPTLDEMAHLTAKGLPFRKGLNHLYEAPHALMTVSPVFIDLSINDFADRSIWENMHGWLSGYIDDTLTKAPKSAGPDGYRVFKGGGVLVQWAYTPPAGHLSSRELEIWLRVLRDEPALVTIGRLFGIEAMALPADDNWSEVESSRDMHVEMARWQDDIVRLRCNSERHDGKQSDAARVSQWTSSWLGMCSPTGCGRSQKSIPGRGLDGGEHASSFQIGKAGTATLLQGRSERRDYCELHVPRAWFEAAS